MNILYNTGISLYGLGERIASWRSPKARLLVEGQRRAIGQLREALQGRAADLWVHAASLGEFEQARPLIERYRQEHPQACIVLTFFSPSGYEVRKGYDQATAVAYLPLDTPANARALVDLLRPKMVIFAKYEFWGNYLQQLSRRGIPTYIISAIFRPGQVFFKPWGGMFRSMLRNFTHLFVQDQASVQLLQGIGVDRVTIAGDTRFDRVAKIKDTPAQIPNIEQFGHDGDGKSTIVVFGSSWPADEDRYATWLNHNRHIAAIIAPHEMDGDRIPALQKRLAPRGRVMLLSQWMQQPDSQCKTLIVDSFGKLSTLYRYADFAYIGGGFGVSIHNINEAAVYGIPVVFGPRHQKFKEALDLIALGGAFACDDGANTVAQRLDMLATDADRRRQAGQNADQYIKSNLGATDKIYNQITRQK